MEAKHKEYLDDILGSQKQEWIWVAVASHLRNVFPELSRSVSQEVVKEYFKCTPANITSVTRTRVCGNCKAEYTELDFDDNVKYMSANLCGSCQESGIVEDDEI